MICSGWWQLTQCIFTSRASHRLECLSSPVCSSKRQKAVPSVFVKKTKRRPRCVRQKEGKTSTMREKWEEPRDNKWGTCLWQLSPPTFIVGKWSHASLLWHFCVLILSYCVHVFDLVSFFGLKGLRKIQPKYVVTSEAEGQIMTRKAFLVSDKIFWQLNLVNVWKVRNAVTLANI